MTAPTFWSYQDNFDFNSRDELSLRFYVPLESHRGDYSRQAMLTQFGLDGAGQVLPGRKIKDDTTVLFGGHVGSGKSTELLQYKSLLEKSYTVSLIEITKILDINNLRYSDLVIALGNAIVQQFSVLSLQPSDVVLKPVLEWFEQRIIKQERFKDLNAELKSGASGALGLPFLGKLFTTFTAKMQTGASYREELRKEVRDGFTQLTQHFNLLIVHANELLQKQGRGNLLFIIDGTDKLAREDSTDFFQTDVEQLLQIRTNLILCAPISVLLEEGHTAQRFSLRHRMPMIKLFEKEHIAPAHEMSTQARDALVSLVTQRLPLNFFDSVETLHHLVRMSGGHPRDLLRLVHACYLRTDAPIISRAVADKAVKALASDYSRNVKESDWADLVKIDQSCGQDISRTDDRYRLLYLLVLLEYNNYWWRTHPLVRHFVAYENALQAFEIVKNSANENLNPNKS